MVIQNRKDCDMQKASSSFVVCSEICNGQVLANNVYRCPFNGDKFSLIGLNNINKMTATERYWDIAHNTK